MSEQAQSEGQSLSSHFLGEVCRVGMVNGKRETGTTFISAFS